MLSMECRRGEGCHSIDVIFHFCAIVDNGPTCTGNGELTMGASCSLTWLLKYIGDGDVVWRTSLNGYSG